MQIKELRSFSPVSRHPEPLRVSGQSVKQGRKGRTLGRVAHREAVAPKLREAEVGGRIGIALI